MAAQQPESRVQLKEWKCVPVYCDRRRIWQRQWFCRDKAPEGKETTGPWKDCNYQVDEEYARMQAERFMKKGHTVIFEELETAKK